MVRSDGGGRQLATHENRYNTSPYGATRLLQVLQGSVTGELEITLVEHYVDKNKTKRGTRLTAGDRNGLYPGVTGVDGGCTLPSAEC